jgi:L-asparagine transporter-like permease
MTYINEHIKAILAIIFSIGTFAIFVMAGVGMFTSEQIAHTLIQVLSSIIMLILGYYFGSSHQNNVNHENRTNQS